jgi:hypothetical protein
VPDKGKNQHLRDEPHNHNHKRDQEAGRVSAIEQQARRNRQCDGYRPRPRPGAVDRQDIRLLGLVYQKGLPPDTNFAQALAAAITEGARALKVLEKEQEPMIAAGIAASKASAEAYAIAFKAWEARMERVRARSEEARREKL